MNIDIYPQSTDQYFRIKIDSITDNSTTDFDLFLEIASSVILYASAGYLWLKEELDLLISNGYTSMLVRNTELHKAQMYSSLTKLPKINKDLPPIERIKSIEQVGSQFTQALYQGEITDSCVERAQSIAQSIIDCVGEDPACVRAISNLASHDYYTYYHSVRVSTYSAAIAIRMGLSDEARLREIAIGGIFHDIGKKEVGLDIVNKVGALNEDEWKTMRSHPQFGFETIRNSLLTLVPQEIILHHHEKLDGSGYPHGLDKKSLMMEVQIATLADVFDALTSSRSYQNKRSKFEALDFIKNKMIGSKLPRDAFAALISCLK